MTIETILAEFENLPNTAALIAQPDGSYVMNGKKVVDFLREKMSALLDELKGDFILSDAINQPTLDFIKAIIESKK